MELTTFKDLEQILLYAIKMPTIKIKYISEETGLGINGLYKWSRGKNHISPNNADILLNWFKKNNPDILKAAEQLYINRGAING